MIVFATVVTAIALLCALASFYFLARFSIAQGRFDVDAQQRAVNLQRYIDNAVNARVQVVNRQIATNASGQTAALDMQPVDPNVRSRGRIDDVHEAEREAGRITGDDGDDAREYFLDQQPAAEITT